MSSSKALSTDQVKIWAETLGIQNLSEDAAEFIVASVNQKMAAIMDRANKNANMSKRMKILKTDVDNAMQFLNLEPTIDSGVADYIPIRGVSGVGGRTLYVQDEKDRELHSVAKKHSGPVPAEVTLRQHWLAVEGKQPTVPENPSPLTKEEQRTKASNPLIARKVATDKAIRKSQMVSIKDLATSDLSAEQQQYYRDITEAVIGSNEDRRREALSSLEHDPGLHALVPRLAVFISEGVKINIVQQNLALLIYIMRMVKAMLDNQTLYLQPYLHLVVPAVTSCIVSRMLCSKPEVDNHWALRVFASKILATLSK
jgi:transcription initiation factor TFIID subunit 6